MLPLRIKLTNGLTTRTLDTGGVGLTGGRERNSFQAAASQLERPALVVWGRQDGVFPAGRSKRAVALLPRSRRSLIDECGYYPQWEQPAIFASAVESFLLEGSGK